MVEMRGFEPPTCTLRTYRSPNWATSPSSKLIKDLYVIWISSMIQHHFQPKYQNLLKPSVKGQIQGYFQHLWLFWTFRNNVLGRRRRKVNRFDNVILSSKGQTAGHLLSTWSRPLYSYIFSLKSQCIHYKNWALYCRRLPLHIQYNQIC